MAERGAERPDTNETVSQRGRYDAAQRDYQQQLQRTETAVNSFNYTREEFRQIESEFLALVEELRRTSSHQLVNLSHLEGVRLRLLMSLDGAYRHAVNELADAMLDSIGANESTDS